MQRTIGFFLTISGMTGIIFVRFWLYYSPHYHIFFNYALAIGFIGGALVMNDRMKHKP